MRPGKAGSERGAWRTGGSHGRPGGRWRQPAGRRGVQAAQRGACRAPGRGTLRRARERRGVWSGRAARSPAGRHQGRWAAGTRPTRDARSDTTPTEPSARGGDRVRRTRTERGDPGKLSGGKGTGSSPLRKRTEGTADEPPRPRSPRLSFSGRPAPPTAGRGSSRGWRSPGDSRGLETATAGSTLPAALTGPDAPWAPQGQASGRVAGGAETRAPAHGHVGRGGGLHGADSGGGALGRTRVACVPFPLGPSLSCLF